MHHPLQKFGEEKIIIEQSPWLNESRLFWFHETHNLIKLSYKFLIFAQMFSSKMYEDLTSYKLGLRVDFICEGAICQNICSGENSEIPLVRYQVR